MTLDITPERRAHLASIGKLGGLTFAATNDTKALSQLGRNAFRDSFLKGHGCKLCPQIDLPEDLKPQERVRRANMLFRMHFMRMVGARRRRR